MGVERHGDPASDEVKKLLLSSAASREFTAPAPGYGNGVPASLRWGARSCASSSRVNKKRIIKHLLQARALHSAATLLLYARRLARVSSERGDAPNPTETDPPAPFSAALRAGRVGLQWAAPALRFLRDLFSPTRIPNRVSDSNNEG